MQATAASLQHLRWLYMASTALKDGVIPGIS